MTSGDGLRGAMAPPEDFDSSVEERFAAKFGQSRQGWTLHREGAILHKGQKTFVPDFVFRHEDGAEMLFEIIGFWTPEYLAAKADTIRAFSGRPILLGVCERLAKKPWLENLPGAVFTYKTVLKINQVMELLERERRALAHAP